MTGLEDYWFDAMLQILGVFFNFVNVRFFLSWYDFQKEPRLLHPPSYYVDLSLIQVIFPLISFDVIYSSLFPTFSWAAEKSKTGSNGEKRATRWGRLTPHDEAEQEWRGGGGGRGVAVESSKYKVGWGKDTKKELPTGGDEVLGVLNVDEVQK